MVTSVEFAPPDLESAASMIRHYGERNSLSPRELLDVFNEGIARVCEVHTSSSQDREQSTCVTQSDADSVAVVVKL